MKVAIIGFGSQAKAWALNFRDSSLEVTIALRKNSPSLEAVKSLNFKAIELGPELKDFPIICLLIPDHLHNDFLKQNQEFITPETLIIYAHGASYVQFSLEENFPQLNHALLAPKAIASEVRYQFETKGKLGACFSAKDENKPIVLKLAKALGVTGGPFETKFKDEAFADLFSEQSLLCGLLPYAAEKSYQLLRKKGISKEVAFMECWLEVKLIADAMVKLGPEAFFQLISPYALKGAVDAQEVLFDKAYQEKLEMLWNRVESGEFLKSVETTDMNELRDKTLNLWREREINQVYGDIIHDLIKT